MPKQDPKEVKEELQEEEKEFYGTGTVSSHAPDPESDDNVEDNLEDVIGNEPDEKFNIGEEVNEDELAIQSGIPEETEEEEDETPRLGTYTEDELPEVINEAEK